MPLFYPARKSMTTNDDKLNQALEYFRQLLKPEETTPLSTSDKASDFIPASLVYEHEKAHQKPQSINDLADTPPTPNTFTPVVESAPVQQNATPEFVLTPMEADLKEVLRHCLDVEKQTLFTVENVLLQQLLRIFQRLEARMDNLEELITDELLGASKDDEQPQSQLVFQSHDEEENIIPEISKEEIKKENQFVDQGTYTRTKIADVPRSSGEPPRAKGNARKRRRRKRNGKNKR